MTAPGYLSPDTLPTPLEDAALDDFFQKIVVGITGIPGNLARPRYQPEPVARPTIDTNWCAVGLFDQVGEENAYTHRDEQTGVYVMSRQEELNFLCSFYGPNAREYASRLRDGLSIAQNREQLFLNGMGFISCGKLQKMTELVQEQYYQRIDVMIYIRRVVARTYSVPSVLSSSGTVTDGQTSIGYDTTKEGIIG